MDDFIESMTAQQVADLAGVHRRTIHRAIKRGVFPRAFLLNGYQWKIPVPDAKAYIETGTVPHNADDVASVAATGKRADA